MAIKCGNLFFFNATEDQGRLVAIVGPVLLMSKNKSPEKIYNSVIKALKDQEEFKFGKDDFTSKQIDIYRKSISDLKQELLKISKIYLKNLTPIDLDKFNTLINENLYLNADLSTDEISVTEEPSEPIIEGIDQETEDKRNSVKLNDFINRIYGTSFGAKQYREDEFNVDIVKTVIINTEEQIIVNTTETLNESIGKYKNSQYKNIVRYLNSINSTYKFDEYMFDENGMLTEEYHKVMNTFFDTLQNIDNLSYKINNQWIMLTDGIKSEFLFAINSYVNLQYFDNLLKDKLGKTIELTDQKFFGSEIDLGYNKYIFGKADEHKVKHWGTNEQKDAISNISKFSKLVLSTIRINSSLDGKFQNKYVDIRNFSSAITHLFNVVYKSNLSTIKNIAFKFHSNPYFYSKQLFEELTKVGEKLVGREFTRLDLDILTSVYNQVYNTNNPNSIISVETKALKQNFSIDSYSVIDSINGVIDRTMEANYLQTKFENGVYQTSIKKKYVSRKNSYSLVNKINTKNAQRSYARRKQLIDQYPIIRPENTYTKYEINIGNNIFNIEAKDGILSSKSVKITTDNSLYKSIFKTNSTDIDFSYHTIKRIISNTNLNEKEQFFRDILQFIDSFLDLDLLSENGLNILNIYRLNLNSSNNYIERILESAIRTAAVNSLYKSFQDTLTNGEYVDSIKFEKFLDKEYFTSDKGVMSVQTKHDNYFTNRFGTYVLNSIVCNDGNPTEEWIDQFIFAESILTGDVSSSTTKDMNGNNIGNYRTSFLGGNIFYYINKYKSDTNPNSAAKSLMFTQQSELIKDIVINTDVQSRSNEIKGVRDMKPAELFYLHIIHNFYGTYLSPKDGKNTLAKCFIIQPTTYSDKVTPINYAIDADKIIKAEGKSYNGKTLAKLTTDELVEYFYDTIGQAYKNTFENILNDYRKLFGNPNLTFDEIRAELKKYNQQSISKLAQSKGIEIQEETHYRVDPNGGLKFNELIYHYANILYKDINSLKIRLSREKVNFLNDLLDSGIQFYTNYATDTKENESETPIRKIIESNLFTQVQKDELKTKWIKNGKLILAKVDGQDITSGRHIDKNKNIVLNPILEKYFYNDLLLSNNLRFALTGTECTHPDKSKIKLNKELNKVGITVDNAPIELIEIDTDGNKILTSDLTKLSNSSNQVIKSLYNNLIRKIEAIAQGTQFKRNVIIPATLQYEQMGVLNGIPSKLKVAIIKDTKASTWNFRGDYNKKGLDAHDGSAYINPFVSILENKALQDQEVGVDKKPIWHHYNPETMSATLLKFATFTITNERMRTSLQSDISLYNMFKKMTDIKWRDENGVWQFRNHGMNEDAFNEQMSKFNLMTTIGFKANRYSKLDFIKDILQDKELFYKEDGYNHKLIVDFGYDEKGYYTLEKIVSNVGIPMANTPLVKYYHKFDNESNHYKFTEDQVIPNNLTDINSLFQLFNVLGGIYSESLVDGQLTYSDQSVYATVNFMNNVSIRTGDSNDMSQRSYYQPLKEMMISYVANSSAVKVGASNVNPSESWKNSDSLTYMELDADGLGIQMDADHDIEEAEMTEFTQVISALEAGGRLHNVVKDVYQALGKLALQASQIEVDAVNNFINSAIKLSKENKEQYEKELQVLQSAMYDVLGRIIINNYKPNNERVDLAKPIIDEISKLFNVYDNHILSPLKLAFSDPNLYSTVISTFMSNLNKKSIKRKYPGSGCVMVPGYGIIQVYKINGIPYQYDDLIKEANSINIRENFFRQYDPSKEDIISYNKQLVSTYLQILQNQEYQNNSKINLDSFIPTDIVDVCLVNEDGSYTKLEELNFTEIDDYYNAKVSLNNINSLKLKDATVIWAHPGTGKTHMYNNGRTDIIDFDSEYKVRINKLMGLPEGTNARELRVAARNQRKQEYHDLIMKLFDEAKEEAIKSGKKLLVSDLMLLKERLNDLDVVTNISDSEFIIRSHQRGEHDEQDKMLWKNSINEAMKSVPSTKLINTTGYLSDLLPLGLNSNSKIIFAQNLTRSRDLAPARITWSQNGKDTNIFDTEEVANSFGYSFITKGKIEPMQDRKAIQNVFDELARGLYHGQAIQNFKNEAAELIMSNLYASQLGLRNDSSLQQILKNGSQTFKSPILPKINVNNYEMCYTTNTNDNLYFTFKKVSGSGVFKPKKINWRIKPEGDEVYYINKEGEKQFQVGAYVQRDDLIFDEVGKVFRNIQGEVIDNRDNIFKVGLNGEVLQYYEYISRYNIIEKVNGKLNTYEIYQINKENIAPTLKEATGFDVNKKIASILASIYSNGSYTGIRLNTRMERRSAAQIEPVLHRMSENYVSDRVKDLIDGTRKYLMEAHTSDENIYEVNRKIDGLTYNKFLVNYYNEIAEDRYVSFLKSLNFTSSRIPAQTLQSFMKMKLIGFTSSSKNICYVTHWQTALQGSDYDIDKAYIMGLSFDNNGIYIGWSDLFDYSTEENLNASETLPIPNKVTYKKSNNGINIDNYMQNIAASTTKTQSIREYAKLLRYLDTYISDNTKELFVNYSSEYNELGKKVLNNINRHSNTKLTGNKLESAMKNFVSSHIQEVIQSPRNMDQAYTSIDGEMSRIRKAAESSPKGEKALDMTMMNPLTKFLMQVSNMVGKGVIGITATGEKVFFNLSHYWNEGIRSGNEDWINNLKFKRTFTRIQGRSKGNLQTKTCTTLANVNFENFEEIRLKFINIAQIDSEIRLELGVTDYDINNNTEKYKTYYNTLMNRVRELQDSDQFVDLNISALLSAATDNAKELILDKINAGLNLARCYIHLMILGFDLNDIVKFMTSPAVSLVNDISNANMFDEYLPKVSVKDAIKILKGDFTLDNFFPGTYEYTKQDQEGTYSETDKASKAALTRFTNNNSNLVKKLNELALNEIRNSKKLESGDFKFCSAIKINITEYNKLIQQYGKDNILIIGTETNKEGKVTKYTVIAPTKYNNKTNKIIQDYFYARIHGLINESLIELFPLSNKFNKLNNNIASLSDYIEMVIAKIKEITNDFESFELDLNEFEQIYDLSSETSDLGSKFLKSNQGLPTSEEDLVTLMLQLQNTFDSRLKKFNFTVPEGIDEYEFVLPQFLDNNPLLSTNTIRESYDIGKKFDLINNFNIETWLYDPEYRTATSKFYNIIKGTWNIFDVIDKLPQFSAIFKLLRMSIQMNNNLVRKSHIIWLATKKMYKGKTSIDHVEFMKLVDYIEGLLIADFVNKSKFEFPIFRGEEYFLDNFERQKSTTNAFLPINSESSRASFKLRFESMIEDIKSGEYKELFEGYGVQIIKDQNLKENKFIKNLVTDVDRSGRTFYKLNLNMQQIMSTPYNSKKYQECLDGFIQLKNYKFNGRPLTDWFMLYNFIVNKNMWGTDRLTSLFAPFLDTIKDNSLIKEYFEYIGNMDWDNLTFSDKNILDEIGFNEQDAWLAVAKIISETQELFETAHTIKEVKNGAIIIKERVGKNYQKRNIFDALITKQNENQEEAELMRQADYMNYSTIQTPFFNKTNSIISIISDPQSFKSLVMALNDLVKDGILQISKQNC